MTKETTTVSLIKCDVGSLGGHHVVPTEIKEVGQESLAKAKKDGLIEDFYVFNCGDDLELLMSHRNGANDPKIHELAFNTFLTAAEKAKEMKLYGAGQDILSTAFSGNVRGMGPGVAELEMTERVSEPVVVLAADKTEPGAWNYPLAKIFADPYNTAGLIIDPSMHEGFVFRVLDVMKGEYVDISCPEELYDLIALIGTPSRYVIERIYRKKDELLCAVMSTTRLSLIAGKYVGKDDPVCLVRAQHGLPAVGEILVAFAFPHLVAGWMRGSHFGPLMPVGLEDARCTVFDGPPRCVGLGIQVNNARLEGPVDLFVDPAFDWARNKAMEIADYLRRHGEFMPARLGPEEMEYTTLPGVLEKLEKRFKKIEG